MNTHDLQAAKAALLELLKQHGIARVTVSYDGEGDSGQTDNIHATSADGRTQDLSAQVEWPFIDWRGPRMSLEEAIDGFTWRALDVYHSGFVNNDGGFGELIIDVVSEVVELEHSDRIVTFDATQTCV